jgi:hypothetical protein
VVVADYPISVVVFSPSYLGYQSLLQSAGKGDSWRTYLGLSRSYRKTVTGFKGQLSGLNAALAAFANVYSTGTRPRRKLSEKGRARISAAQRARWARVKGKKVVPIAPTSKARKRPMSASVRDKIAAAQRARWAKVKREKKAA